MLFLDPKIDYGPRLNTVVWLLVSVSAIFLFTRLYLKNCQNRGLWWDDWTLLAAWVCQAGQAGLVSYIITLGYGRVEIPVENLPLLGFPVNVLSTLLITANFLGKASFALTLLRIPAVWMRLVLAYILLTLAATLGLSCALVWIECFEFKRKSNCVAVDVSFKYNMFSCVYSAVMDVALAFLPWKFIWTLQMSKKEKIGVVIAMSMGIFAAAAAALKTTTLPTVSTDPLASISLLTWGNAESAICIMAASIPILRALVRGGMRGAVPMGGDYYGTYPTTATTMVESGGIMGIGRNVVVDRSGFFSTPPSAPSPTRKKMIARDAGSGESVVSLDRTLTGASPEPAVKGGARGDRDPDWSSDEDDSIEMTNYQNPRPHTPKDFLGGNVI
ncbi:hypothetical protein B0H67DRAFT_567205 [Lasiosphaeris hirsuta]|uniref:Rhodopsin domain-containing protein n=1 Tax=Lasiosphaeris hirsuta TaxID=260670 RepID=A0AA40AY14_9PEZI|nr:hypothetical protein B0H67DRAFT_567205 [Lasiosphaeris hirsuta]